MVGYPHNSHANIVSKSTSFLESWYHGSRGSQIGKTIDDFSPSAACKVPASTMKTHHQGRSFQFSYSFISLCPAAKVCAVFNNRVLPSSYWATKSNGHILHSTESIVLGGHFFDQQLVERYLIPCTGNLFNHLWLLGAAFY